MAIECSLKQFSLGKRIIKNQSDSWPKRSKFLFMSSFIDNLLVYPTLTAVEHTEF